MVFMVYSIAASQQLNEGIPLVVDHCCGAGLWYHQMPVLLQFVIRHAGQEMARNLQGFDKELPRNLKRTIARNKPLTFKTFQFRCLCHRHSVKA